MAVKTLNDLFLETLKDIYYAEKKLTKVLPKIAKQATSSALKGAFQTHLAETEIQVQRIEEIFESLGKKPVAKKCEALEGILAEAGEVTSEIENGQTLDAAIISSLRLLSTEIIRYGTLALLVPQLGLERAEKLWSNS
jgi:ferritin-like metal-binding protein YciE